MARIRTLSRTNEVMRTRSDAYWRFFLHSAEEYAAFYGSICFHYATADSDGVIVQCWSWVGVPKVRLARKRVTAKRGRRK